MTDSDNFNETWIQIYQFFGFYILRNDFTPNDECLKYFEKILLHYEKKVNLTKNESLRYIRILNEYANLNNLFKKNFSIR